MNFSRKRWHRIGDLVSSSSLPSRKDRAERRQQAMELQEQAEVDRVIQESLVPQP